MSRIVNDVILT